VTGLGDYTWGQLGLAVLGLLVVLAVLAVVLLLNRR
jgi:hypothetical protein